MSSVNKSVPWLPHGLNYQQSTSHEGILPLKVLPSIMKYQIIHSHNTKYPQGPFLTECINQKLPNIILLRVEPKGLHTCESSSGGYRCSLHAERDENRNYFTWSCQSNNCVNLC
ncbi:hypothetical protein HNY73_018110 [Argiope bruennichi]|uniref:Uncharacterized protein n=1 Tax=Argiope bruennichi TaxID=94029 RepID=A0A8T0EBU9_ARGBR|nr:hypothetical protein HNY73_018110 [Argiope bruennichi]